MSLNQEERHIMYGPPPAYPGLNPNDFILPEYEELILDETETYLKNAPVPPQYFLSQMIENDADFEKNMDAFSLKQEINGLGYTHSIVGVIITTFLLSFYSIWFYNNIWMNSAKENFVSQSMMFYFIFVQVSVYACWKVGKYLFYIPQIPFLYNECCLLVSSVLFLTLITKEIILAQQFTIEFDLVFTSILTCFLFVSICFNIIKFRRNYKEIMAHEENISEIMDGLNHFYTVQLLESLNFSVSN